MTLFADKAGELLADIFTISPSLSAIPSASGWLDASNYTVQAISFGKDALGYQNHAHSLVFSSLITDGIVRVVSTETVSAYHSSAALYGPLPEAPNPVVPRLESKSTAITTTDTDLGREYYPELINDLGHNTNTFLLSANTIEKLAGCYPPSGGVTWYILSSINSPNTPIAQGTFLGNFNLRQSMDLSGFVNMIVSSAQDGANKGITFSGGPASGLIVYAAPDFSSTGEVQYRVTLSGGDAGLASMYGGIYNLGLWTLDLKAMANDGLTPPFSFSALNNQRRYRLFAKASLSRDITYITNYSDYTRQLIIWKILL